ncbi:MAG: hypothetical protein D6704_07735 [Nitrospirae bacterium]|nr:MAG: hypothetical protein D6704_07735 [Nitrospirota bacterium]
MRRRRNSGILWAAAGITVFLGGCAPSPITLHPDFGRSVTMAKEHQTLSPEASANLTPVTHLHGTAASKTMEAYEQSFEPGQEVTQKVGILVSPSGQ